jgi:hypothetical protein
VKTKLVVAVADLLWSVQWLLIVLESFAMLEAMLEAVLIRLTTIRL